MNKRACKNCFTLYYFACKLHTWVFCEYFAKYLFLLVKAKNKNRENNELLDTVSPVCHVIKFLGLKSDHQSMRLFKIWTKGNG